MEQIFICRSNVWKMSVASFAGQLYNTCMETRCEMKHEVTTLHMKKALAASLKGFMEKKPLSKITVSEREPENVLLSF